MINPEIIALVGIVLFVLLIPVYIIIFKLMKSFDKNIVKDEEKDLV